VGLSGGRHGGSVSWIFCAAYFVWVLDVPSWKEALLPGRFASPTSAGVLFSMRAAAGLATTWVFKKARVLAIFDDLDTILFMIPLKMMMVEFKWQLSVAVFVIVVSLSYGLGGPALTVAVLSLALNLLLTGVFITVVRRLIPKPVTG